MDKRERKGDRKMLTWNVTYHCKKGQRAAFYEALCELGIRKNSRAEDGNLGYDYYFAAEAEDDLLLVKVSKWIGGDDERGAALWKAWNEGTDEKTESEVIEVLERMNG